MAPETSTAHALNTCMSRQHPFGTSGTSEWQARLAAALGLTSTLRPRGRPPKEK